MADKHDDKKKENVKVLRNFRIKGEAINKGAVIPKSRFIKKTDWQNLAHMDPAKVEETSDKVTDAPKAKTKAAGGLPAGAA